MESKGTLKSVTKDWTSGRFQLIFELEQDVTAQIEQIQGKPLRVTAKQWREKRSLDANAYYWVLCAKLADVLRLTKPHLHNLMLRRYGQPETIDGKLVYLVLPDSDEGEKKADEAETYHIKPTAQTNMGRDGKRYRTYIMLRGSSTYDTAEMTRLIDGIVDECKAQGIETMTPDELDHMMEQYEQERRRHEKRDR